MHLVWQHSTPAILLDLHLQQEMPRAAALPTLTIGASPSRVVFLSRPRRGLLVSEMMSFLHL
jgi:hypothetical protein